MENVNGFKGQLGTESIPKLWNERGELTFLKCLWWCSQEYVPGSFNFSALHETSQELGGKRRHKTQILAVDKANNAGRNNTGRPKVSRVTKGGSLFLRKHKAMVMKNFHIYLAEENARLSVGTATISGQGSGLTVNFYPAFNLSRKSISSRLFLMWFHPSIWINKLSHDSFQLQWNSIF